MLVSQFILASAISTVAFAAPGTYDASTSVAASPLSSWISSSLFQWVTPTVKSIQDDASQYVSSVADGMMGPMVVPDYSDYSIWDVIQENEHLADLKKVLKYAGPESKELLNDKEKKLTFLAPINWRKGKDHDKEAQALWDPIQREIDELEEEALWSESDEDKDRKERKKKVLAYLIDKTLLYHVIDSKHPLKGSAIAQNSSVATLLTVGKAKRVIGNLWDGEQFRLRVGKSLLPRPGAYFNFYSRLVYADVQVGESIVHAVSFPILIPPSILQSLFFAQNDFSGLTSALQKVDAAGYFKLPINESAIHHHHHDHKSLLREGSHEHHHHHPHGVGGLTLFAPANTAFGTLPFKLKLFLFSPFGARVLKYILALHSLPKTIFYADWYHTVGSSSKDNEAKQYTIGPVDLFAATGESTASRYVNVSEYTFDSACPKLHFNKSINAWVEKEMEFETVDVKVYRYYLLPNEKGPLQTRITANNVSVLFQDIPSANGVFHRIDRFMMPKHHPHKGLWAHIAHEAEKAGFGSIDLSSMAN